MADRILEPLKEEVEKMRYYSVRPCLATVMVGSDCAASKVYLARKRRAAEKVGVKIQETLLPRDVSRAELLRTINELNLSAAVHGVLLQLPLPEPDLAAHELELCNAVDPRKDVDGFTARNLGAAVQRQPALSLGHTAFYPCTPLAVKNILVHIAALQAGGGSGIDGIGEEECRRTFAGRRAVVLGRSHNVGAPLCLMLLSDVSKGGFDMTTTSCHRASGADAVRDVVSQADVVVSAVGRAGLVTADMVKPGAVVVDVGLTRTSLDNGRVRVEGDVHPDVAEVASFMTPVPGGVGPCTVACLMHNVVLAAKRSMLTSDYF